MGQRKAQTRRHAKKKMHAQMAWKQSDMDLRQTNKNASTDKYLAGECEQEMTTRRQ